MADRVRSLNELRSPSTPLSAGLKLDDTSGLHHTVSATTNERARPFARRDSKANTTQPANHVYSPSPLRFQPELPTTIEKQASSHFKPVPEPDLTPRDHVICPRHGRRLATRAKKTEGSTDNVPNSSPEICPDCLAEQHILMREHGIDIDRVHSTPTTIGPSSTITERGTPVGERVQPNSVIGTTADHDMVYLPGATLGGLTDESNSKIVAVDLGNMLDAIIIHHSGILDKVIANSRSEGSRPEHVQKIAGDLAQVAKSVAAIPKIEVNGAPVLQRDIKHAMVLDMDPVVLRSSTRSVPQLLDFIDAAAHDLGVSLSKPGKAEDHASETVMANKATPKNASIPHSVEPHPVPGGFMVTPMPSPKSSPRPSAQTSVQPVSFHTISSPSATNPPRTPSPPLTALPSEVLRSYDLTPLPPSDRRSPAPRQSRPSTPLQGSESKAFIVPGQTNQQLPMQPPKLTTRNGSAMTPTQTISRIPTLRRSLMSPAATTAAPRSYLLPVQQRASLSLAPYQGSASGPRALVKPSEVKKKDQQQRTFEQEWLKEASRAANERERIERRGRMTPSAR